MVQGVSSGSCIESERKRRGETERASVHCRFGIGRGGFFFSRENRELEGEEKFCWKGIP